MRQRDIEGTWHFYRFLFFFFVLPPTLKETGRKNLEQLCHIGHIIWGLSPFTISLNKTDQNKPHQKTSLSLERDLLKCIVSPWSFSWKHRVSSYMVYRTISSYIWFSFSYSVWREQGWWGWWAQVGLQFPPARNLRRHQLGEVIFQLIVDQSGQ